jgi:hypothetical protein
MLLQEFSSFFNLNFAPGLLLQSRLRYCVHGYIEHVRILSAPKWGFRQEGLQLIFMEWAKPSYDRRIDEWRGFEQAHTSAVRVCMYIYIIFSPKGG